MMSFFDMRSLPRKQIGYFRKHCRGRMPLQGLALSSIVLLRSHVSVSMALQHRCPFSNTLQLRVTTMSIMSLGLTTLPPLSASASRNQYITIKKKAFGFVWALLTGFDCSLGVEWKLWLRPHPSCLPPCKLTDCVSCFPVSASSHPDGFDALTYWSTYYFF